MRTMNNRAARQYADDFPSLTGNELKELIPLSPSQCRSYYSPGGNAITLYRRFTDGGCPAFRYVLSNGQDGILNTSATQAGFGGVRWWYVCPHCHQRCGRLYWTRTRAGCRQCMGLHYRCQSESTEDRELRRIRKGRHAIWGCGTPDIDYLLYCVNTFPRPKGMHRRRYALRAKKQNNRELNYLRALLVLLKQRYRGKHEPPVLLAEIE